MSNRCAIYARVSSESQKEGETIQSQLNTLPKYAESQGWDIVKIYKDDGRSGAFIVGRPDFEMLLADMEKQSFEIMLVTEHSRVTRTGSPVERGIILKALKDNKIKLASPAEGMLDLSQFSGELMATLKLMFAAEQKAEMLRTFARGRREKLNRGVYCLPSVPYGLKKITDKSVNPVRHEVVFDTDQCQVLRTVYDLIVNKDKTINYCSDYLNRKGIKTARGKRWLPGNLSRILSREKEGSLTGAILTGRYVWETRQPDPVTGKPKRKLCAIRPKAECLPVSVPAIFTKEEFNRLRQAIEANDKRTKIKKDNEAFLLRDKLKCIECGRTYGPTSGGGVKYYVCRGRVEDPRRLKPGEKKCNAPRVRMDLLDDMVFSELLMKLFMFPEQTLKGWTDTSKVDKIKASHLEQKLASIDKDIEAKERQIKKLIDLYSLEKISIKKLDESNDEYNAQLSLLEEEKIEVQKELNQAKKREANVKALKGGIKDLKKIGGRLSVKVKTMPFAELQKLIGWYIPRGSYIEIMPCHPDEEYYRYVKPEGAKQKLRCHWDYYYSGHIDIKGAVNALKEFDKTGKVPSHDTFYSVFDYPRSYSVKYK